MNLVKTRTDLLQYKQTSMEAKIELRGRFLNGGSTAVVGGCGEGKTFLMNILAGYKSDYKVGGSYNYVCKQVTSTLRLIYWI